jgi:hypothetical protein
MLLYDTKIITSNVFWKSTTKYNSFGEFQRRFFSLLYYMVMDVVLDEFIIT